MFEGSTLTLQGWVLDRLHTQGGRTQRIEGEPYDPAGNTDPYLLPGFTDLYVCGGGGRNVMEGSDAFVIIARTHRRFGTTSLLVITMTAPHEEVADIPSQLGDCCRRSLESGSWILGVRPEDSYTSSDKFGTQPNFAHAVVLGEVEDYLRRTPIQVITIAPEVAGRRPLIRVLVGHDVRPRIGHTLDSYKDGAVTPEAGASSSAHFYNAVTGLHHRRPGIVGAVLAHARYAELILDPLHVHPGAIGVALRLIPYLYRVTNSTTTAGTSDGQYKFDSRTVVKCLDGVHLPDSILIGSTPTVDQVLCNLMKIDLPLAEVSQRLLQFLTDYPDLAERGRLTSTVRTDVARLDRSLEPDAVTVEGELERSR